VQASTVLAGQQGYSFIYDRKKFHSFVLTTSLLAEILALITSRSIRDFPILGNVTERKFLLPPFEKDEKWIF